MPVEKLKTCSGRGSIAWMLRDDEDRVREQ